MISPLLIKARGIRFDQCLMGKYSATPQLIVLVVVLVIVIERSPIEHEDEDDDENDTQSGFAEGLVRPLEHITVSACIIVC